jgi:hypothetical protein
MSWLYFQDDWALNHVCTFDGVNKIITVGPNTSILNVKKEIYSDWKEWQLLRDNSKYLPAIRSTGGDPIGGGAFTGDVYFLINGWRILIDHSCTVDGVIYSDDYPSPFIQITGTQIVTNKVSSLVTVIAPTVNVSGLTVPTAAENAAANWSYITRSLTQTPTFNGPTAAQIRQEMDSSSTVLSSIAADTTLIKTYTDALESTTTNILNAVNDISIGTSAINVPAVGFTLTAGAVTSGTYVNTRTLDGTNHVISDTAKAFDCEYLFDIGLNAAPSQFTIVAATTDQHETVIVHAWNYITGLWDTIGNIPGTKTNKTNVFTLYQSHVGFLAGTIGDVKIRFTATVLSDLWLSIDQMYISHAVIQKESGWSGHVVSATASYVQIDGDAVSIDNYYVPSILRVDHGTGLQQFAKVIGYVGSTKTLQLELPMAMVLDTTSHITLTPWASANMPTTQYNNLVSQVAGLTPTQETMILEMYELLGLNPTKPLIVSKSGTYTGARTAGTINQSITGDANQTIVTRV